MRLKSLALGLVGLLFVGSVAVAQTPAVTVPPKLDPENTLNLDLSTGGRVAIQLRPDVAPKHVERIKTLARRGFYDGIVFHRVIDGFMAQTGDPTGTGTGGSELPNIAAEFNALPHVRGAVSAARTNEPNTANSQFFIVFTPRLSLDGKYSVFGRVIGGMQHVDAIERGEPPANPSFIVRASIGADNVPALTAAELAAARPRVQPAAPPAETEQPPVETAAGTPQPTAPAPQ
jgi:cyclophilin family peptidyl-prolyl cis-trans isomerase